ncbi:hypothetical protein CI610_01550 [invertebrate metagenome]|uniref:Uncharacterized protein n=1 Tax=invertebrate metagenome TaxID=1711999 RepID=A0A2H9T8E9_9ZZZZ
MERFAAEFSIKKNDTNKKDRLLPVFFIYLHLLLETAIHKVTMTIKNYISGYRSWHSDCSWHPTCYKHNGIARLP